MENWEQGRRGFAVVTFICTMCKSGEERGTYNYKDRVTYTSLEEFSRRNTVQPDKLRVE